MEARMQILRIFLRACIVVGVLAAHPAHAGSVVVGVNAWYRPPGMSQEEFIKQLADNGVKTIRISLLPSSVDFIIQAHRHGIGTLVIVGPQMGSNAKGRTSWSDVPLTECNPQGFTAGFKPLLDQLEAAGVRLTGIELGNEPNNPRFNGDLPNPGSGRVLGLADLNNPKDPEGPAIAAGFRTYIQVAAALKDIRDHSKLNQQTPIVAAGMSPWGPPHDYGPGRPVSVSLPDAIKFLQQNGLDKYVDGYGVHLYPGLDPSRAVATRIASLGDDIFSECRGEKPCWLTEWGIPDSYPEEAPDHCPIDETKRLQVIQELRGAFQHFVDEGQLAAVVFYDWADAPGNKGAIFRCGALTEAGKLALSPIGTHQIVSQATGLCFDIRGNTNNSGEAIISYPCGGSINMEFNFVDQGNGFYSIHTVNGRHDLCLNISNGASSPGDGEKFGGPGNLIQWSCGSGSSLSDNELFRLVDLGGGRQQIRVKNSGLCLEDPGSRGTIRQNVCSSSPNQTFTLTQ
jgi:hypothetical protein